MTKLKTNLKNYWFAYLDNEGVIRVQKYESEWQIQKLEQLPFVKGIFDPFPAKSKNHAKEILREFLNQEQIEENFRRLKQ